ncbi:MAG TPA: protein-glutamate O-methyltransferase CheR [Bacillota bacterium]|nr:protein-glutamate O-methyltransferase CheR [Bacillota bacterium]
MKLDKIIQVMQDVYEIDISKYDEAFLLKAVEKRVEIVKIKTASDYIVYLLSNNEEAKNFFDSLMISYTDFFRNSLTFAHLEQWVLPQLIAQKSNHSELRIWSAGCATGQEPYSIAMLLEKMQTSQNKQFRYRIIATDISEAALSAAKKGEYNQEAIQNLKVKDLSEFFIQSGETYTVSSKLKNQVSFSSYDLLDDHSSSPQESIFGNFDLVFCSNLLFYYKPEFQRTIISKLKNSLTEKGYLITGEVERQAVSKEGGLRSVNPPSLIFQKITGGAA